MKSRLGGKEEDELVSTTSAEPISAKLHHVWSPLSPKIVCKSGARFTTAIEKPSVESFAEGFFALNTADKVFSY